MIIPFRRLRDKIWLSERLICNSLLKDPGFNLILTLSRGMQVIESRSFDDIPGVTKP
jgi:hypothetical protein